MNGAQVVVKEVNVATRHLERRRAVAEDALQGENIAAIREERSGEGVPQDMRRAASGQAGGIRKAGHKLLDARGVSRSPRRPTKSQRWSTYLISDRPLPGAADPEKALAQLPDWAETIERAMALYAKWAEESPRHRAQPRGISRR